MSIEALKDLAQIDRRKTGEFLQRMAATDIAAKAFMPKGTSAKSKNRRAGIKKTAKMEWDRHMRLFAKHGIKVTRRAKVFIWRDQMIKAARVAAFSAQQQYT